jgi:predicted PhzF superfamily epimerase YddE/YHI9
VLSTVPAADGWTEMDFPADPPERADLPPGAFGIGSVRWSGRGRADWLIELDDAAAVRAFQPDFSALAEAGPRGVLVTAAGDREGLDCVSRFFGPAVGIPEDPVTGSAHCTLAVFWGDRTGRAELLGEQASPRGGTVRMRRDGDRVVLGGQAVTVSEIDLLV